MGGSYFLECLTSEVEKKAMEIIKKIDDLGMAAAAIEKGFYERLINRGIYDSEREFDERRKRESGGK